MGEDVEDFRVVGSIPLDVQELLQVGGTSNTPVRSRFVGDVTLDWEYPGQFPTQGGPLDDKDASE